MCNSGDFLEASCKRLTLRRTAAARISAGRSRVLDEGGVERLSPVGMDIIGMTNLQEAKLAREARSLRELAIVTITMLVQGHDDVTVDMS